MENIINAIPAQTIPINTPIEVGFIVFIVPEDFGEYAVIHLYEFVSSIYIFGFICVGADVALVTFPNEKN